MKFPKLFWTDYFIIVAIVLFLATHFVTTLIISYVTPPSFTEEQANIVIEIFEFAPVAKWALRVGQLAKIFDIIMTPALVLSSYVWVRRKSDAAGREAVAIAFFFIAFTNFLNDIAIFLGIVASI